MIQCISLILCLLLFTSLNADENIESQIRQAETFFEVNKYDQAESIYQNLLKKPLEPWQRAIVRYNIGYFRLIEGKWQQAIEIYSDLISRKNLSPEISSRIHHNLALALLGQARTFILSSGKDNRFNAASVLIPLSFLKEALRESEEAKDDHCQLEAIEGYPSCSPWESLQKTQMLIKQELSLIMQEKAEYQLHHLSPYQGVNSLIEQIELIRSQLEALQKQKNQPIDLKSLVTAYRVYLPISEIPTR